MKILFLTQLFPYPVDSGGKYKTVQTLKMLIKMNHKIYLVCFKDSSVQKIKTSCWQKYLESLKIFSQPIIFDKHKFLTIKLLLSIFSKKPFTVYKYFHKKMAEYIKKLTEKENFDIVYIDHLCMAQYIKYILNKPKLIYDEHNISSLIYNSYINQEINIFKKAVFYLEYKKWQKFENKYINKFDKIFAISEQDRQAIVNLGIDLKKVYYLPVPFKTKPLFKFNPKRANILFIGLMSWKPNKDGFWWFYNQVFPKILEKIPKAKLIVVGRGVGKKIKAVASQDKNLILTGYIENIEKIYKKADVVIVPVFSGGGVKIKILEALSFGMPVICTTKVLKELRLIDGREIFVASNDTIFATKTIKLLKNKKIANNLSKKGLLFIKHNFYTDLPFNLLNMI
jgi:polysaccharide biosynthesis protein PslH